MLRRHLRPGLALLAALVPPAALGAPARIGAEIQVNVETRRMQRAPDAAVSPGGTALVVWATDAHEPPQGLPRDFDVRGRFFDPAGTPRGGEIALASSSQGDQLEPRTAADGQGNFLVVWTEGSGALFARSFRNDGQPWSAAFRLGDATFPAYPAVAGFPGGGFVVTWQDDRPPGLVPAELSFFTVLARRLDGRGVLLGSEIGVSGALPDPLQPGVAAAPDGSFLVTWTETLSGRAEVRARLYGPTSQALGNALLGDGPVLLPFQSYAVPVTQPAGGFSVAWLTVSGSQATLQGRRLDAVGRPQGFAVQLTTPFRTLSDTPLDVAADATGRLLTVWSEQTATDADVRGRVFDASWQPLDDPFPVNTYTGQDQIEPALATAGNGRFLALWASGEEYPGPTALPFGSEGLDSQDGNFFGVFGQRLSTDCLTAGTVLCLAGGRFKAEVEWTTATATGTGKPVSLTDDTGAFWFFGSTNLELMVKVLDGRAVNGRFWVFYGALSDVEYTLTVTDTANGSQRSYRNPAGTLASQADTAAFTAEP